jgi:cytochrome c553
VTTSSLLPTVSRAAEASREAFQARLNEAAAWVEWIQASAPSTKGCVVCESQAPTELHHVAGKFNSDLVVPVCVRCHGKLTRRQERWDPRWELPSNSPELREALVLRGLVDLCEERGRFDSAYHVYAASLASRYAYLARKTVGVGK